MFLPWVYSLFFLVTNWVVCLISLPLWCPLPRFYCFISCTGLRNPSPHQRWLVQYKAAGDRSWQKQDQMANVLESDNVKAKNPQTSLCCSMKHEQTYSFQKSNNKETAGWRTRVSWHETWNQPGHCCTETENASSHFSTCRLLCNPLPNVSIM